MYGITNEETNFLIVKTREFFEFTKRKDFIPTIRFSGISEVDAPKIIDILCSEDYHGFSADKWHIGTSGSVWMDMIIGRKVIRAYFEETTRGKFVTTCNFYRNASYKEYTNPTKIPSRIPVAQINTGGVIMGMDHFTHVYFEGDSERRRKKMEKEREVSRNLVRVQRKQKEQEQQRAAEQQRADKKLKKMEMESKRKEDAKKYVDSNLKPAKLPDNYSSNKSGDETSGDETSGDEMKPRKIKRRDMVPDEPVVVKESKNSAKKASKKAAKASRKK